MNELQEIRERNKKLLKILPWRLPGKPTVRSIKSDIPYLLGRVEQLEKAEYARDQLRALIGEALEGKDAELFRQLAAVTAERDRLLRVIELVADPENYNGSYRLPVSLRSMAQQALAQKG